MRMFRRVSMTTGTGNRSDMDDFAKLAADQQAEIVRLNNELARTLAVLKDLAEAFDSNCDIFCQKSVRFAAYRAAMEALK